MNDKQKEQLKSQKAEAEDVILLILRYGESGRDYFFVRGLLERLIEKIEERLDQKEETAVIND